MEDEVDPGPVDPAMIQTCPELDPEIASLVTTMLPQARAEAWKVYRRAPHALEVEDLISLAYTGLMMAAARWRFYCEKNGYHPGCGQVPCADPASCGTRYFCAYALRRLRGSMLDALRSADWVTRSLRTKVKKIRAAEAAGYRSEAEVAAAAGLTVSQVRVALGKLAARPVAFEVEEHDLPDAENVESGVVVSAVLGSVVQAVDRLDATAQAVLALRYHQGWEFPAIAGELELSEDQVRAAHAAGVLAVRDAMVRELGR